jgi:hypothetical protein
VLAVSVLLVLLVLTWDDFSYCAMYVVRACLLSECGACCHFMQHARTTHACRYQQQDAQEYLAFMVDGIHEDLVVCRVV